MIINKDFFFYSAKDLTPFNYLDMSMTQVLLISEAPELANIYSKGGLFELRYEASFTNGYLDSKYPIFYKFGEMSVTRSSSGFRAADNPAFNNSVTFGTNYNATLFVFEDYCCQALSSDHEAMDVIRFNKTTTSPYTFRNSYARERNMINYWISVFGLAPGYIWERSINNDESIFVFGANSATGKDVYWTTTNEFKDEGYLNKNIWNHIDVSDLPLNFSSNSTYSFLTQDNNLIVSTEGASSIWMINTTTNDIEIYNNSQSFSRRLICSKGIDGKTYLTINNSDGYKVLDVSDGVFTEIESGSGSLGGYFSDKFKLYNELNGRTYDSPYTKYKNINTIHELSSLGLTDPIYPTGTSSSKAHSKVSNYQRYKDNIYLQSSRKIQTFSVLDKPDSFKIIAEPVPNEQHKIWVEKK